MKKSLKIIIAASLVATAAVVTGSASAQVSGIAIADPTVAIAKAKALSAGYQQIQTTYAGSYAQITTKSQEVTAFQKQLDTNNDNQVSDAELQAAQAANSPVLASLVAKQKEIEALRQPIRTAQWFVIQNITAQYEAAQKRVVDAKKIGVILTPDSLVYGPASVDVTPDITAQLDAVLPSVSSTPPANWRPTRQTAAIHQQIQQLLVASARQQAAQQAAAQPQPAAQPQSR